MNYAKKSSVYTRLAYTGIALLAFSGCGGNSANPPGAVTVIQPATSTLQLAVGSANLFGTSTGLNIVTTLRTPQGKSVLVSTPTITGPFALPAAGTPDADGATIETGPSPAEVAMGGIMSGSAQLSATQTTLYTSTFGTAGGVFAGGLQPANANQIGGTQFNGNDDSLTPYVVPAYNNADANSFTPIGGPPAFDPNGDGEGTRDGTFNSAVLGVNEVITAFEGVTSPAGQYKASVLIPTNTSTGATITTAATVGTPPLLGTLTSPTFVPDGSGGGSFAVTLTPGVTYALLDIVDLGPDAATASATSPQPTNCYTNGSYPAYFTIHVTGSGTYTLPDTDGVGSPTVHNPTICTAAENTAAHGGTATDGDSYEIVLIGADYPIYSSNYLFNLTTPNPTIVGAAGSDDITISPLGLSPDFSADDSTARRAAIHSPRLRGRAIQ